MKKIVYIAYALILFVSVSRAQNTGLPKEEINIHVSEKCVLPGDEMWLTVYVSNQKDLPGKTISNLAFVEFVSDKNQSLVRKKILLEAGVGTSSITIPDTLSTGIYHLLVYTNWAKNFGENAFASSKIMVVNPSQNNGLNKTPDSTAEMVSENLEGQIRIDLNKSEYNCREKVELAFYTDKTFDEPLVYSVSVAPKLSAKLKGYFQQVTYNTNSQTVNEIKYYPDYNGFLLSGTLINKYNNQFIPDKEIVMSFPGETVQIDYAKTDKNGAFRFLLKPEQGEKDIVFNLPGEEAVIRFDESFVNGFKQMPEKIKLELDERTWDECKRMYVFSQLQKKFGQSNIALHNMDSKNVEPDFFGDVYQKVFLKDFTRLDSIAEYFYELTPTVHFQKRKGEQLLFLTNPETNFQLGDNPAVFVDGVYYPDNTELALLDYNVVEQINVIPQNYFYKDQVFNGIVSVFTYKKNFSDASQLETMNRLIYPLTDSYNDFKVEKLIKDNRIPDLRRLLHWSTADWNAGEKIQNVTFFTSDIDGAYTITITAVTKLGEVLTGETTLRVKTEKE
ncbi:hypothetical protein [uncultured Draconibacterium sp.]|uniref:hypothetical protein n=1 Tax=uncultured Draconibacterium sp. TaxID=1573823 RepID=UPI003217D2AB